MTLVVTGLSQNGDLTALTAALERAGVTPDDIQSIGPREALDGNATSLSSFARSGDGIGGGTNTGSGTGVPGINSSHLLRSYFRTQSVDDRLGDLDIPVSEADNYLEALDRGRTLIAYRAQSDSIDRVESAFREAGLLNVRRF